MLLTFGLLAPNKGVEHVIAALPAILAEHPDALYVVLGATHPHLVRREGEAYRERLAGLAAKLGVQERVLFLDRYVDLPELLEFIAAADVYVTPYLNQDQITSGTLAYAFGCGKPVISTPYWHAAELLADGRGVIVPFHDPAAIARETNRLLADDGRRGGLARQAWEAGRGMIWSRVANRYVAALGLTRQGAVRAPRRAEIVGPTPAAATCGGSPTPAASSSTPPTTCPTSTRATAPTTTPGPSRSQSRSRSWV
jgi:glycosyltransferase involved in cell wall biosynthesis